MNRTQLPLALSALLLAACAGSTTSNAADASEQAQAASPASFPGMAMDGAQGVAVFAGGCFWCVESAFDELKGVISAESGYIGGPEQNPTYYQVAGGKTGHAEAVRVLFDPAKVSYQQLVDVFWHNIDPFQANAQFCDTGPQYRSELFFSGEKQRDIAEKSRNAVEKRFKRKVVTKLTEAGVFWTAEEYHQDFHKKNPVRYLSYRMGCGRDRRLLELWGTKGH